MVPKQASAIQVFDLSDLLKLKNGTELKVWKSLLDAVSFHLCFKMISQAVQEWRCPRKNSWQYLTLPSLTKIGCLWSCLKNVPEMLPSSLEILGMFVKNDDWAIHPFSTIWWSLFSLFFSYLLAHLQSGRKSFTKLLAQAATGKQQQILRRSRKSDGPTSPRKMVC